MTSEDGFDRKDLRRLNEIANQTYEDLSEIPKAHPDLECLIQALSEMADKLSFAT